MDKLFPTMCLLALTLLSGIFDARGFIYAAQIWQDGVLDKGATIKALLYFQVGIAFYLISLRFLQQITVISPELQSLFWFAITLIGVAIINGKVVHWSSLDRVIAVIVLSGLGWLMFNRRD